MISQESVKLVKATAPALADHAETLTRHFYKRMFSHNPEVIPYFNPAHQREGRQQKALAAAICAYAANIDRLEVLGPAVELIAQKHASLQVKPEHYPIVGENLLASIREVLGAAATDAVIAAWAEAYGLLAKILSGREGEIYEEQSQQPGGWAGFKPFTVIRSERESEVVTSFYLVPRDGQRLPLFKAGQYITLRVPSADGTSTTMRNYSLSEKPGLPYFRISVKREEGLLKDDPVGYVSHYLHSQVAVDASLEVAAPCGEFVLETAVEPERPLVLLAAGIGITPLYCMLRAALEAHPERRITLVHALRNPQVQPFKAPLEQLARQHPRLQLAYRYSESDAVENAAPADGRASQGFVDAAFLAALDLDPAAAYFICGPEIFMTGVQRTLAARGVPPEAIHSEFFGPKL